MKKSYFLHSLMITILFLGVCLGAAPAQSASLPSAPLFDQSSASAKSPLVSADEGFAAGSASAITPNKPQVSLNATSWCFAGDINSWNNESTPMVDDGTNGDLLAGDGVYSYSASVATPGNHIWKAVECGNWGLAYPAWDSWYYTSSAGQLITFTLDTNDYSANVGMQLLPAANIVNVTGDLPMTSFTAVGDFQGWNNADPDTEMTNIGSGYYRLFYTIPTAGSHSGKVVMTNFWNGFGADGRSVDAANLNFTTTTANQDVVFLLDTYTGRLLIEPVASGSGTWCVAGDFDVWASHTPIYDDGTHGDLVGGDGIYSLDFTVTTAGRHEWKATNCTWDLSYPAANSWLVTTEADQVVKLTFDTNDHSADVGLAMLPNVNILHAWDSSATFTAVGDWQGWDNANPTTAMTAIGQGMYRLDAPLAAAGTYQYKITSTGTWDAIGSDNRSVNAVTIPFTTFADGDLVPFLLDYRSSRTGVFPPPVPQAGHDNQVWWAELGHNSRDTLYRNPTGPVTTGTPVTLRLRAASGDLTAAKVRIWNDRLDSESLFPMSIAYDDGTYAWWQVEVPASPDPTVYWYRFLVIDGTDTDYYEDDAARTGGWGEVFDESVDNSYQLTVYDGAFQTPDWMKNAIVYQVYPDRFRDGDDSNNKTAGAFFYDEPGGTVYRSLTTDWNEPICDPRGTDDCANTYSKNFYGGDLAGLIEKLDYIQALGVNTIYLNPIFESPSNHGYDTTDYLAINPMFGTEAEFFGLVAELESRGMHLILDGVFNHVSSDSIYFDRYGRYSEIGACESETSPYRDWFYFTEAAVPGEGACVGDDGTPGGADYESWWGYDSLPKMDSTNPEVRALIWDNVTPEDTVAGYYMDYADGWRLDVGADVDPGTINDPTNDYWEGFRNTVRTVNPEGYITGEEWGIANSWLLGGEWDAVMNYQFSSAVLSLWRDEAFTDNDHNDGSSAGTLAPITPSEFDERILNLMERYNPESLYTMLNLFGSHDTSRALFMLDHNADLNDPTLYQDPAYDWSDAIMRLKGAALIQMTMPGAPTIYYGDEVGLVGPMAYSGGKWEDDPYNRQPFPWLDESGTPFYTHLKTQAGQEAIFDYYAVLTAARSSSANPALRTGDYRTLLVDNDNALYAYGRHVPAYGVAIVVINRSSSEKTVSLNVDGYMPYATNLTEIFSSDPYAINAAGMVENIVVPANSGVVLMSEGPIAAPPEAVIDLLVTDVEATTVTLNWSVAVGANGYLVYRSNLSGGGYTFVGETNDSTFTFTDTGLTPGERVYYIVYAINTTGLISGPSNEVTALPAYVIGWANLESPATITHTIGTTPTVPIYGQVLIDGVTSAAGPTDGLWAQVGYGHAATLPTDPTWIWNDATFDSDASDNDRFSGTLLPEEVRIYNYAYRYSTDGGESWYYADLNGPFDPNNSNPGVLTVTASSDNAAPSIPTLSIVNWGADFIEVAWSPSSDDGGVYAYDLYRSTDNITYTKIARILNPGLGYRDEDVVKNSLYYYMVKAVDTSFNFSDFSNMVSHTAEPKMVAVTFNVTVPDYTPPTVYLTRFINADGTVGDWSPDATALDQQSATLWSKTFNILDDTVMKFKFARGNWETVIKGAADEELGNLSLTVDYGTDGTQLYEYTVFNWRDPIVTAHTPLDAAVGVPVDTTVTTTWSTSMAAAACFTLSGPEGDVPGTCAYDDGTKTITFTPTSGLACDTTYTALVSGLSDSAGDVQQVPVSFAFTTTEDLVPPSAPVLSITDWGTDFIDLAWTAASDNVEVARYDLYSSTDGITFTKLDEIAEPTLTYQHTALPSLTTYYYKIRAVDTNDNLGEFSNTVSQRTDPRDIALTINVHVPDFTPGTVYIAGNHALLGNWVYDAVPMTTSATDPTLWSLTITLPEATLIEFAFSRGSEETLMRALDGNTPLDNFGLSVDLNTDGTMLYTAAVPNWRDPIVLSYTPASIASITAADPTISLTWSQAMAASSCPVVSSAASAIAGTCSLIDDNKTILFEPDGDWPFAEVITVTADGLLDAGGDAQQVEVSYTFTTDPDEVPPSTPELSISGFGTDFIEVAWTQATDNVEVASYELYYSTDGVSFEKLTQVSEPTLSYQHSGLLSNTTYYYQVRAVDVNGNLGEFSIMISQTTESTGAVIFLPMITR